MSEAVEMLSVRLRTGAFIRVTRSDRGVCRGCGAEMLWAITEKGNRMPLDPAPDADGVFTSHWATCQKAGQFRKKGPSA